MHFDTISPFLAIGSGLNSLSNFMYIDLERISWDDCNLNSGDCLTPKGFTFARVLISDGLWVDLYNLHTDAGSDDGDRTARAANLAQVSEFMQSRSAGMPVVVMGDTNARYSNDVDGTTLRTFVQQNGLEDAWIQVTRGGTPPALNTDALVCPFPFASGVTQAQMLACETVDKIFVRGSEAVPLLSPTSFTNENGAFLNSSGSPLSDHYPISAVLEWILSSSIRLGDSIGGPHGTVFNDIPGVITEDNVPALSSITLRAGDRVDGLTYTVSSSTVTHGGTGGTAKTLSLKSGEYIVQVTACSAQHSTHTRIFYLQFTTNLGSTLEGGVSTSDCLTTTVPTDAGNGGAWGLVGFWGRGGEEVDRIAPIWGAVY